MATTEAPVWLRRFYRRNFAEFTPTVIQEGKAWAIARIRKDNADSYVLVRMKGNEEATPHIPLFTGTPTADDITRMQEILFNKDKP